MRRICWWLGVRRKRRSVEQQEERQGELRQVSQSFRLAATSWCVRKKPSDPSTRGTAGGGGAQTATDQSAREVRADGPGPRSNLELGQREPEHPSGIVRCLKGQLYYIQPGIRPTYSGNRHGWPAQFSTSSVYAASGGESWLKEEVRTGPCGIGYCVSAGLRVRGRIKGRKVDASRCLPPELEFCEVPVRESPYNA